MANIIEDNQQEFDNMVKILESLNHEKHPLNIWFSSWMEDNYQSKELNEKEFYEDKKTSKTICKSDDRSLAGWADIILKS